jgi:hypothetical protein
MKKKAKRPDYKAMFKCDTVRIAEFPGRMFLIIGWKRNSSGEWFRLKDGEYEPFDFDYVDEQVVASGRNAKELLKSAEEHRRVSKLTPEQYLRELVKKGKHG